MAYAGLKIPLFTLLEAKDVEKKLTQRLKCTGVSHKLQVLLKSIKLHQHRTPCRPAAGGIKSYYFLKTFFYGTIW